MPPFKKSPPQEIRTFFNVVKTASHATRSSRRSIEVDTFSAQGTKAKHDTSTDKPKQSNRSRATTRKAAKKGGKGKTGASKKKKAPTAATAASTFKPPSPPKASSGRTQQPQLPQQQKPKPPPPVLNCEEIVNTALNLDHTALVQTLNKKCAELVLAKERTDFEAKARADSEAATIIAERQLGLQAAELKREKHRCTSAQQNASKVSCRRI